MLIKKGERFNLSKNDLLDFTVNIEWDSTNYEIDSVIFLLKENKASDNNIIFSNNPIGANDSVVLKDNEASKEIKFDLNSLPDDIDKIVITLTIENPQNFGQVSNLTMKIDKNLTYNLDKFSHETAITLIEIYKKNSEWRLKAVGTGFVSGLDTICSGFGI